MENAFERSDCLLCGTFIEFSVRSSYILTELGPLHRSCFEFTKPNVVRVSGPGEMKKSLGQICLVCQESIKPTDTIVPTSKGPVGFIHIACIPSGQIALGPESNLSAEELADIARKLESGFPAQNPPDYPYNLTKNDPVHSPSHYTFSKYQVQDVLDEWNLDHYYRVIIQYLVRAGRKVPQGKTPLEAEIEDCEKALWYLSRKIDILKNHKQS